MAERKILLGLTTTPGSDWREKTREIDKFGIKEIALFPTFLKTEERKELYSLLEKTGLRSIPHIHLRDEDMSIEEIEYLIEKYNTQIFNIHTILDGYPRNYEYSKYKDKIFIENTDNLPLPKELEKYPGICLDISHWENSKRVHNERYKNFEDLLKKYRIGCCHISAFPQKIENDPKAEWPHGGHYLENLDELDYVEKYKKYLPNIISIELENSFKEQLKAKEYLEKMINQ